MPSDVPGVDMDLREAITEAVRAAQVDNHAGQDFVVGEFIVIASAHGYDPADGEALTQVIVLPDGGSEHRILGLVEHARIRLRGDVLDTYGD